MISLALNLQLINTTTVRTLQEYFAIKSIGISTF